MHSIGEIGIQISIGEIGIQWGKWGFNRGNRDSREVFIIITFLRALIALEGRTQDPVLPSLVVQGLNTYQAF